MIPRVNSVIAPAGVTRPTPSRSVNQTLPSAPAARFSVLILPRVGANSVTLPAGVIRAIFGSSASTLNHTLPSGPAVIPPMPLRGVMPAENSVTLPCGVMRATQPFDGSVNHTFPSGPAAMSRGPAPRVMPAENIVTFPSGVILPTRLAS